MKLTENWGSTTAIAIGWIQIFLGIQSVVTQSGTSIGLTGGATMILGAHLYRSAKNRRATAARSLIRIGFEAVGVLLIVLLFVIRPGIMLISLWALVAYAYRCIKPVQKNVDDEPNLSDGL